MVDQARNEFANAEIAGLSKSFKTGDIRSVIIVTSRPAHRHSISYHIELPDCEATLNVVKERVVVLEAEIAKSRVASDSNSLYRLADGHQRLTS